MRGEIKTTENSFIYTYNGERVEVVACGDNAVRVKAGNTYTFCGIEGAIEREIAPTTPVSVQIDSECVSLKNGILEAKMTVYGQLSFYRKGKLILKEFMRNFSTWQEDVRSPLGVFAREYRPLAGGRSSITVRFAPVAGERIYGMGQYQHSFLDLKGMEIELAHRNTQASVPFYVSSLGYGFLWNNPAVGVAFFGKEKTTFTAQQSEGIDYWICAGETYKEISTEYCSVTGFPSAFPDYATGFWQSKLRYSSMEEVLSVAREYKRRSLPLSVLVIDFFHWEHQGDWAFDRAFWQDPAAMVKELNDMGVRVAVSIWPTVERGSVNYEELLRKGYLMRTAHGKNIGLEVVAETTYLDVTNPEAGNYFWNTIKNNYYKKGVRNFWLDIAEPEYACFDPENYVYAAGNASEKGNLFPVRYSKIFYDGLRESGEDEIVNLVRCAWAGSQKYGALVWSGDINSTFSDMRNQLQIGLNMGLAGIPWWNTDIGGFHGGDVNDPAFKELLIRWFEWGTFCPVMRLHGDRIPRKAEESGNPFMSGADNEVWSYGEEAYEIFKKYLFLRERLRPYLSDCMREAHEKGYPVMRTLFYEFPDDEASYSVEDEYLLGGDILVAPILEGGVTAREVYLPCGCEWVNIWTGELIKGGRKLVIDAPLERIPVFIRRGSQAENLQKKSGETPDN